ncbi:STAS domain-containing protein [Streptomyces sp. NPDC096032]|uniref:STAS domain-containing protein n=1 Tax=Streptomyces sp. NPDC096032 TaxID=3366070 RepID=UPI0038236F1C
MFSVQVSSTAQARVFALRGELDYESAVQLHEAADQVLGGTRQPVLVVDCTGLEFCDSSGIGCLVRIHQRLSAQGAVLRLAAVPASVARVFALTGLDQAIPVHATLDEALGASGSGPVPGSDDGLSSLRSA